MIHPSYTDLMKVVNSEVEPGEEPVVNSRYSIVLATAKRARQIIKGSQPLVRSKCPKPLSIAVDELNNSKIRIMTEEEYEAMLEQMEDTIDCGTCKYFDTCAECVNCEICEKYEEYEDGEEHDYNSGEDNNADYEADQDDEDNNENAANEETNTQEETFTEGEATQEESVTV